MKKKGSSNNCNDEITDERFLAATNRPQFRSGGSTNRRRHKSKSSSELDGTKSNNDDKNNNNNGESGTLHSTSIDKDGGFGESLTEAIRSDDRFSEALTNSDKFGCVPQMDKYGRKIKKSKKQRRDDDSGDEQHDSSDGDSDDAKGEEQLQSKKKVPMDMESRIAYLNALSRGEISASSSDEDDSSDDDDDDSDKSDNDQDDDTSSTDVHGQAGVFDPTYNQLPGDYQEDEEAVELTTDPTPYLCILNLDWEHTRAVDVYAMLHSFCPPGTLKRVDIYPSDYGKKMMEKERLEGPSGLWKVTKKSKDDENSQDDSSSSREGESDAADEGNISEQDGDESDSDDEEEDILNLDEATAKLYSHFPPQSAVMKNSQLQTEEEEEEGFDHEKLRAYEASKLRYYFAIATFSSASAAEPVYENVDGMEMEHSAAEIDVRALPADQYGQTIEGRELHDSCDHLPGKYAPPDNVVTALRQSKVTCSWERGDSRREKILTKWGMGKEAWDAMNEGDDIKFYLASDNSSAGEESDEDEVDGETEKKGKKIRALLGLGGSDDEDEDGASSGDNDNSSDGSDNDGKNAESSDASSDSESEDESESKTKQVTFTPGKKNLEDKIRSKLQGETPELTPFQKYLEKRKEKRRERRQAARKKGKGMESDSEEEVGDDDGMYGVDPEFGVAKFSDEESIDDADVIDKSSDGNDDNDEFFLEDAKSGSQKKKGNKSRETDEDEESKSDKGNRMASTKEELELLIAGDNDEEDAKDFDMRGLQKLERHANKKLRGKRKRQLETLAANVSGQGFQVDTKDDRFSALLDGADDRFGIDRTNPAYKETTAMKTLLEEQAKRRKKNRSKSKQQKGSEKGSNDGQSGAKGVNKSDSWVESSSGAMELSSLVKSLQTKVKSSDKPKKKKSRQ